MIEQINKTTANNQSNHARQSAS